MPAQPATTAWSAAAAVLALLQPELFIAACLALAWWRGRAPRWRLPAAAGAAMLETP